MSDQITVLRSASKLMAKVWEPDGSITAYGQAKWFSVVQEPVQNIHELATLLERLQKDPHACVIRGAPKGAVEASVRRLIENFDDVPLHAVLIEVDNYRPVLNHPVDEPLDATLEFIAECLPKPFQGAPFWFQLSNSAGAPGKEDLLKVHIWTWLRTPYNSATLRAWAKAEGLALDTAVYSSVQCHYVAAPVFKEGVTDPVRLRSGFWPGVQDDVPLVIDVEALKIRPEAIRQRGEHLHVEDPVADWIEQNWETWGSTSDGGIITTCPFDDFHSSGEKGTSATVYFPAGTNSHPEGSWICLHSGCRDKHKAEFLAACGYADQRLSALAAIESPEDPDDPDAPLYASEESLAVKRSRTLLGISDDLPPFGRNGNGEVHATADNFRMALSRPDVTGMTLRMDKFKEDLVWCNGVDKSWRSFKDTDYFRLALKLEHLGFKDVPKERLRDAVHFQADEDSFDTARDWLESLEWDGVPRIDRFWIEHFGVVNDNRGYARAVGAYTWTALAGRVLEPGIQVDMMPILAGPQGVGKSRGVAAMSPVREFAKTMSFAEPEINRTRKMRGALVVEFAELQGLRTREREEIKAWVTRSDEEWTPKFKEMNTEFKRRCVFFGTTNEDDFLDDPTGERRWLPLGVGKAPGFTGVDREGIARDRAQLWAEGAARFRKEGIAWEDAQRLAEPEHDAYRSEDTWRSAVSKWLDTPALGGETPRQGEYLLTQAVAEGALSIPARLLKFSDQRKIGVALRAEGYDLKPKRVDGKLIKVWARK
jgi:hypothetical protein